MPTGLPDCTSSVSSGAIVRSESTIASKRPPSPGRPARCRRRRPGRRAARRPPGRGCSAASAARPRHPSFAPSARGPRGARTGLDPCMSSTVSLPASSAGARRAGPYGGPPHCADDRPVPSGTRRGSGRNAGRADAGRLHVRTPCSAGAADRAGHPARGPTGGGTGVPGRRGAHPARRPELVGGPHRRPARRRGLHRPRQRAAGPAGATVRLDDRPARPGPRPYRMGWYARGAGAAGLAVGAGAGPAPAGGAGHRPDAHAERAVAADAHRAHHRLAGRRLPAPARHRPRTAAPVRPAHRADGRATGARWCWSTPTRPGRRTTPGAATASTTAGRRPGRPVPRGHLRPALRLRRRDGRLPRRRAAAGRPGRAARPAARLRHRRRPAARPAACSTARPR